MKTVSRDEKRAALKLPGFVRVHVLIVQNSNKMGMVVTTQWWGEDQIRVSEITEVADLTREGEVPGEFTALSALHVRGKPQLMEIRESYETLCELVYAELWGLKVGAENDGGRGSL
jgi:hypothetical protein